MPASSPPALTPREQDVLRGVVAGKTNAEIGHDLGCGYDNIKQYVNRLRTKLGAKTKTALAAIAVRDKLVEA